jgi:hypothetical protein
MVCGGPVPVGSALRITSVKSDLVLETASYIANQVKKEQGGNGLLIFSCFSRNVVLPDSQEEMRVIETALRDFPLPFLFLYAGGEYCPRYTDSGQTVNRFHQYTIIACLF